MTARVDDEVGEILPEYTRLGQYRLVQRLGEGGMGVVHLALDRHGRAVALKVLRPHVAVDPDARARLAREVDSLGRIRSPLVAPIVDADVDGERPFIVTRYIPGPALDEVVNADGPLRGEDLLRLGRGLAEALRVIHDCEVVHRDVKPGNVLLLDGDPVLIDFGIAHVADEQRLTVTGLVMGTPGYLAPEVVEGAAVTAATDWWGWAATLAYAATGTPPFGRGPMDAILARVSQGEPDLSRIDPKLEPLLYAALSPRPDERPHHSQVVAALESYAHGEPVTSVIQPRRVPPTQALASGRTSVLPAPTAHVLYAAAPTAPAVPAPGPAEAARSPMYAAPPSTFPPASASIAPAPVAAAGPPMVAAPAPGWAAPVPASGPPLYAAPPVGGLGPLEPLVPGFAPPADAGVPGTAYPMAAYTDPRIGRPARTGSILALAAAALVGAATAPAITAIVALVGIVLARTADRSVTSMVLRRHARGHRRSDLPVAVLAGPWHVVLGALATVLAAVVPLLVGVSVAYATVLGVRAGSSTRLALDSPLPLAAGALGALLIAWWGPGGASLRRGTRSLLRGLAPGEMGSRVVVILALVVAVVCGLLLLQQGASPTWVPWSGPPSWMSSILP